MYEIKYLPAIQKDLEAISDYISITLEAPQAALNLLDAIEAAIVTLKENPRRHRLYHPLKPISTEYRVMTVKNYLVFYVVLEGVIEIHRIIYKKRDFSQILTS
ncbi:translation repressor RelE [Spirochaetia bacterium]|nr:translation repressor RelE [Spirochaetia bacterium]